MTDGRPDDDCLQERRAVLRPDGGGNVPLSLVGPWVLVICGAALIVAAFVFRSSAAVAAPGVVLGASLVVLGTLLPRIEGPLKLSATGVEAHIRKREEARRQIVETALQDESVRLDKRPEVAEIAAEDLLSEPYAADLQGEQLSDIADRSYLTARNEYQAFERRVQQWLEREGWTVKDTAGRGPVDFVARRGDEIMLVEAKLARTALTGERLRETTDRLRRAARGWIEEQPTSAEPARALFISAPNVTAVAVHDAITSGARVYSERDGAFIRIDLGGED